MTEMPIPYRTCAQNYNCVSDIWIHAAGPSNCEGVAIKGVPFKMCTKKAAHRHLHCGILLQLESHLHVGNEPTHACTRARAHFRQTIAGAAHQHCSTAQREKRVLDYDHQPLLHSCIILCSSVHVIIYVVMQWCGKWHQCLCVCG